VQGGQPASGVQVPFNGPNFDGLGGEVHYLGLKMDLNNAAATGAGPFNYGWVGIRIDNDADATGAVVGYAYQTIPGVPIAAGDLIPEPGTLCLAGVAAAAALSARVRRLFR
jgi:hypothetical protein